MSRTRILVATLAVLAAAGAVGTLYRQTAAARPANQEADTDQPKAKDNKESVEMAAVRKTADAFARAFASGNAKAVAAFWTSNGEYVGADGETLRGRDAIEKSYVEFFKRYPKATVKVDIDKVRMMGLHAALEEGMLRVTLDEGKEPSVSRYSVLHVRDDDGWKMASVREWVPDPAELISLKDVEWLLGEWTAKSKDNEATASYAWDEDRAFIRGRYQVKRDGKVVSAGTQIIGKNPAGGLKSWQFDSNGATGEWLWTRDEKQWVIETAGILPDGNEVTAVNLLIPTGKDAFTWQTLERTVAGSELPGTVPVKVTRVKGKK
jgi:uncharacterized protein (TIGR02246 family)